MTSKEYRQMLTSGKASIEGASIDETSLTGTITTARAKDHFRLLLDDEGLPPPVHEWAFHHQRRWRVDLCWPAPEHMLAVEIEGGVFGSGKSGHTTGTGYRSDLEKYNELMLHGYRLLRFLPEQLATRRAVYLVRHVLNMPS